MRYNDWVNAIAGSGRRAVPRLMDCIGRHPRYMVWILQADNRKTSRGCLMIRFQPNTVFLGKPQDVCRAVILNE